LLRIYIHRWIDTYLDFTENDKQTQNKKNCLIKFKFLKLYYKIFSPTKYKARRCFVSNKQEKLSPTFSSIIFTGIYPSAYSPITFPRTLCHKTLTDPGNNSQGRFSRVGESSRVKGGCGRSFKNWLGDR
jgi:hypothetical protein